MALSVTVSKKKKRVPPPPPLKSVNLFPSVFRAKNETFRISISQCNGRRKQRSSLYANERSSPDDFVSLSLSSLQLWLRINSVLTLRNSISVAYILWSNPCTFTTDLMKCWNSWNLSSPFVAPYQQHPADLKKTKQNKKKTFLRNLKVMKLFFF